MQVREALVMGTTPTLNLTKPEIGSTNWGTSLNLNFDAIDAAIAARIVTPAGIPAIGDMIAWNGTAWVRIVPSADKVLIGVNGAIPSFATLLSSIITVNADIPMASHKLTGLAAGTENGDAIRWEQLGAEADARVSGDAATLASAGTLPGRMLGITYISTAGAGTFTTTPQTRHIRLTEIGAGGGGGGSSKGSAYQGGGGGGSGAYVKYYWIAVSPSTGYNYVVGTGGTGGTGNSAGWGTAGGPGGETHIVIGGVTYAAPGGSGGSTTTNAPGTGGAGATTPSSGDERLAGNIGNTATSATGGAGANIILNFMQALGYGVGGTGGSNGGVGNLGVSGYIIIEEYS